MPDVGIMGLLLAINMLACWSPQYNQMSDYWNQSRYSITGSGLLTTYAHGYCHGCQKLENWNLHLDLWHL